MNRIHLTLFLLAIVAAGSIAILLNSSMALVFLVLICTTLNRPQARCCLTLSVPELLQDTMDAFKVPLLPTWNYFWQDFSKDTAVKGDKITAHLSHLPSIQAYDATNGFNNSPAQSTSLIEDAPVTLSTLEHSPVQVKWLDQLSARKSLYKEAIRNQAYVFAKRVVDQACTQLTTTNFSNKFVMPAVNYSIEALESLRNQCNSQQMQDEGRWGLINTNLANAIQNDDRVKSSLFYSQLNGNKGYRIFTNICGFEALYEYPPLPTTGNMIGFVADKRAVVFAMRRITFSNAAEELGAPEIMRFYPMVGDNGMPATGVMWQAQNTGDVFVTTAILYGLAAGCQGGAPGTITDNAGLLLTSS